VSVFFFVLIVVLMCVFVLRYRRKAGVEQKAAPSHSTGLEITWTVIPLILVIVIFYLGLRGYVDLATPPQDAYEVQVTAQKWSWTFDHPNGATEPGELTVPLGQPVKLIMQSQDVIHSLYIPAFRVKKDVVPGRYNYMWFTATEVGDYDLLCAEYCGTDHSQMNAIVHVVPEEEFEAILEAKARWIDDYADENLYQAGQRLHARCVSCHSLDGSPGVGPSFVTTHEYWGKPRPLKGGATVVVDENYIRNSILNPDGQIVENYAPAMPTFKGQLKPREVTALVQFIRRLNEVVNDQGEFINPEP